MADKPTYRDILGGKHGDIRVTIFNDDGALLTFYNGVGIFSYHLDRNDVARLADACANVLRAHHERMETLAAHAADQQAEAMKAQVAEEGL